ncbi:MAG TPA: GerAB/ArcD/ProY family transporter [Symbiobacteriaceae bacterium]|nr:GerAB/ArcD/ProY family transporter [Symbiobacteriaceae bacterium]
MEQISPLQVVMISIQVVLGTSMVLLPASIFQVAGRDGAVAFLLATVPLLAGAWLLAATGKRFPDAPLCHVLVGHFPVAGRVMMAGYTGFMFLNLAFQLRMLNDFTTVLLLPRTPLLATAGLVALVTLATARGGWVVVARMTQLFLPSLVASFFVIPLMLGRLYQPRMIAPILEWGVGPALAGGWVALGFMGQAILPGLLIPFRSMRYYGVAGLALAGVLVSIPMSLTLLVLGPHLASRFTFPMAEMVRHVRLTDFLDRWDLFVIGMYLPVGFITAGQCLHMTCAGLHRLWSQLSETDLVTPVGVLGMIWSLWFFGSPIQVIELLRLWPGVAVAFYLAVPLLLWLFLRPAAKVAAKN